MSGSSPATPAPADLAVRRRRGLGAVGRLVLPVSLLSGALVWIGVAQASSVSPVKGGIYEGMLGASNSPGGPVQETVTVSSDGRRVASVIVVPPECGVPPGPLATVRNIKVVNGSFTAAYPRIHTRAGIFDDATLTAHFLAHGRLSGAEDVRSNDTFTGGLCKYSLPLTATAQPPGTKQCPNHTSGSFELFNILVSGTTCTVVDAAANKGIFTRPGGPTAVPVLTTPGWICGVLSSGVNNHRCTRAHPKASFSFGLI